jgi:hypothetical protein
LKPVTKISQKKKNQKKEQKKHNAVFACAKDILILD